jgi:hypothetical protein
MKGLLILSLFLWVNQLAAIENNQVVAIVNGYPMDQNELQFEIAKQRTMVYCYFAEKVKLGEKALDWTKNYNGEVPLKVLHQWALKKAIEVKIQQLEMYKYGLPVKVAYSDFLVQYELENKQRKSDALQGKVIYGLPSYSESNYFDYVFTNQLNTFKALLEDKGLIKNGGYQKWLNEKVFKAKIVVYNKKITLLKS